MGMLAPLSLSLFSWPLSLSLFLCLFAPLAAPLSLSLARARSFSAQPHTWAPDGSECGAVEEETPKSSSLLALLVQWQQFTCFTSTRVQILTQDRNLKHAHADGSGFGAARRSTLKQQVLSLLALLVQQYLLYSYKCADLERREGAL